MTALTNSQRNRREKEAAIRRDAVDALVSRLMLRLPVEDPGDLLDVADEVEARFAPVGGWG